MGIFSKLFTSPPTPPLPDNAVLLDVRSPEEYAKGHIEGAVPLPLHLVPIKAREVVPDKSRPVVVYCQSGGRSGMARQQLLQMGYGDVTNGGGIQALAAQMQRDIVR